MRGFTLHLRQVARALALAGALYGVACSDATPGGQDASSRAPAAEAISEQRLAEVVAFLAAPERDGRKSCLDAKDAAAEYVATSFRASGLVAGGDEFLQEFPCAGPAGHSFNVIGRLPGVDPRRDGETIVIGAHYDHLGRDTSGYYPGADDNASGVAALVQIAEAMAARGEAPRRTIVFVAFGGEEQGRGGSRRFVQGQLPVFMLNLDMVGHLDAGRFQILGGAATVPLASLIREITSQYATAVPTLSACAGAGSDHGSFEEQGVPVLFFHTGVHTRYHSPRDTADSLNYAGLAAVTRIAHDLLWHLATTDDLAAVAEPCAVVGAAVAPGPSIR